MTAHATSNLTYGIPAPRQLSFSKAAAVVSASAESVELTISLSLVTTAAIHLSSPCQGEDELAHTALEEMVLFYAAAWQSRFSGR